VPYGFASDLPAGMNEFHAAAKGADARVINY
jgi:hypothetical protein